ncbi:FCD domain-containing protein [Methylobacterium sp. ARG-1]|uniref:GntR family transcriptional regulator n=1 Tax=Methylobacterium sp. ARG-1 TaxID=1692501 RepID=UPI0006801B11|nr:FCD domain-containing protein [Methylobacterium sp. ARG-1]
MARTSSSPASSLAQSAYLRLRAEILSGKLAPGSKLKIADLARDHGISAAGIREALSRLAAEGLALAEPQKGFRAALMTEAELLDLTMVRTHIENLCLEQAVEAGDLSWEAGIAAAIHRLSRVPEHGTADEAAFGTSWAAAHEAFHSSLVAACPSPWLLNLRRQLWSQSERYRQASVAVAGEKRDVRREHEDLAEAALARDTAGLKTLMSEHLERTTRDLITRMNVKRPARVNPGDKIDSARRTVADRKAGFSSGA